MFRGGPGLYGGGWASGQPCLGGNSLGQGEGHKSVGEESTSQDMESSWAGGIIS